MSKQLKISKFFNKSSSETRHNIPVQPILSDDGNNNVFKAANETVKGQSTIGVSLKCLKICFCF